jgi:iron complex transport system ATP-binding protein
MARSSAPGLLIACAVLIGALLLAFSLGRYPVGVGDLFEIITAKIVGHPSDVPAAAVNVLFQVRGPRVLTAVLVGAALAVAGTAFQGLFRNPLVSPDLLGASSGAALGALIAYVPQSHVATFAFNVETIVLMGRTAHGSIFSRASAADRAIAAQALERFGISHLSERPYTMISGGERQLVLLARAMAQEPQFIVLDEPTASLDFGNQGKVMREIRKLRASGHGVLFTTHDPNHAARVADRVYLLRDGARLAEGAVDAVLGQVQLEALYQAPVELIADRDTGRSAFLPG